MMIDPLRPALLSLLLLSSLPLAAQEVAPGADDETSKAEEGMNLLGEGARLLFEGLSENLRPRLEALAEQMEPALRDMVREMGPALNDLAEMIGDLNAYHPPERLPNGDIILRRKDPLPESEATPEPGPDGSIDL